MVQENTNKTDKLNKLTSEGSGDADLNLFPVGIDILLTWQGYESKQHKCPASNGSYTRNRQRGGREEKPDQLETSRGIN